MRYLTDRKIVVVLLLVIGFSVLGPFGTYERLDLWSRVVFWSVTIAAIGVAMHLFITLALTGPIMRSWPRFARICVGAMTAAVPGAGAVIFFTGYFYEASVETASFPYIWFQVASVGIVVGIFEFRGVGPDAVPAQPRGIAPDGRAGMDADTGIEDITGIEGKAGTAPGPEIDPYHTKFHRRLPDDLPHDIISLTMKDHYVEVTTTSDQHRVLMRLTDAVDELQGVPGQRLHRSHWAANAHVCQLVRQGKKLLARLSDGRELPVSKSYEAKALATFGCCTEEAGADPESDDAPQTSNA